MRIIFTTILGLLSTAAVAQVGIGTFNPLAGLHVTDSSVLFSASGAALPSAATPIDGEV